MDDQIEKCKQDFRVFLYIVWQYLGLPAPTPVQYDLAYFLQYGSTTNGGLISRRMLEAFRGIGKSWITSAYVVWLLWRDPDEKILVVSASKLRSDDFSIFTKKLINEIPFLNHLKAKDDQRDSNIAFDVGPARPAHSPSVKSVGITGQLTGSRATRIIADDIESANNSSTDVQREKLLESIKEFDAIITPDKTGEITFLGTPQSDESIYNKLPERGYQVRIWPARYVAEKDFDKYKGFLAPMITKAVLDGTKNPGDPVEPTRFSDFDLIAREASYGRSGFLLQFMLDTSMSDAERYPLKLADLVIMPCHSDVAPAKIAWASGREQRLDIPSVGMHGDRFYGPMWKSPEWLPYNGTVMAIDPSGRGKDETGYAVVKALFGYLYVVAVGGLRDGYSELTLKTLAAIAQRHRVNEIIIEENYGGGMFNKLLEPVLAKIYPCTINEEGVKSIQRKELRMIDTLEPVMNQHRLVVDPSVIEGDLKEEDRAYQLFYQMTRVTKDKGCLKHDDRLDALSMAVAYWISQMNRDVEQNLATYREKLYDDELARFRELALSQHPQFQTNESEGFFSDW